MKFLPLIQQTYTSDIQNACKLIASKILQRMESIRKRLKLQLQRIGYFKMIIQYSPAICPVSPVTKVTHNKVMQC